MVIVTHESYDSVLVGTGKQKGLESLSENCECFVVHSWSVAHACVCAETVHTPVDSIAMMQIDCKVTATRLVHIDKSAVPDNMLNVTMAHQQHGGRMWPVSDADN